MLYRKLYALSTYYVKVSGSYTILKLLKQPRNCYEAIFNSN